MSYYSQQLSQIDVYPFKVLGNVNMSEILRGLRKGWKKENYF